MRVLVTWGSKSGGTEGIGQTIAEELRQKGVEVTAAPVETVRSAGGFDAAIIGGALYSGLWHGGAYRFVSRHIAALKRMPVFLFASGPLDDSADTGHPPRSEQLETVAERVGALRTVVFGGRLSADAKGFPASAMARTRAGDWRNFDRVRRVAADIAERLPSARPGVAHEPPARAWWRLGIYGVAGWALCAAVMGTLMATVGTFWALVLHLIAAPLIFWALARSYFRPVGAREPLVAAAAFTAIVVAFDAVVVAGFVLGSYDMFFSLIGTWLPFALIFAVTYATGMIRLMMPRRLPADRREGVAAGGA